MTTDLKPSDIFGEVLTVMGHSIFRIKEEDGSCSDNYFMQVYNKETNSVYNIEFKTVNITVSDGKGIKT